MIGRRIESTFATWIVFLGMVTTVATQDKTVTAQDKPLIIESSTMQPRVVLGRPMLTWWDVKIRDNGLFTGKLQFSMKTDTVLLGTLETDELTLNGPEQRIRVLLPPVDPGFALEQLNVEISFRGKRFSGKVSDQILQIPFASKKVFLILFGESKITQKRSARDQAIERLKFENLIPRRNDRRRQTDDNESVKTLVASIPPTDFPSEAMAYCSYDLVALLGEEFRTLRKAQLEALLAWIKAGGSAYIEPNGVLEPYHIEFLRDLVAEDVRQLIIQQDPAGRLPADTLPSDLPAAVVGCGLGHAAIRLEDPENDEDRQERDLDLSSQVAAWRPIIGPLWKMRQNPIPVSNITVSNWQNGRSETSANPDPWGIKALKDRFGIQPENLLDRLMPDKFQMVPAWVLAMILLAFVVMIGPGDYFVLGWFRARSLTWVTFPVLAIAVTVLTVWLSTAYMSAAETRRAVEICDLGPSGDIVRTNRFELLFVASSHRVTTEIRKGIFVALGLGQKFTNNPFIRPGPTGFGRLGQANRNLQNPFPGGNLSDDDPPIDFPKTPFQGRIPTQYSLQQELAKWTPQLNRLFSIPGSALKPEVPWSDFDLNTDEITQIHQHALPPILETCVREHFGPKAMVGCFAGKDGWAFNQSTRWFSSRSAFQNDTPMIMTPPGGMFPYDPTGQPAFFRWIDHASVARPDAMFTLTDHTAPKGGMTCEDLLVYDVSDPKSWLLVVVVPAKDDFIVYRKLMRIQE